MCTRSFRTGSNEGFFYQSIEFFKEQAFNAFASLISSVFEKSVDEYLNDLFCGVGESEVSVPHVVALNSRFGSNSSSEVEPDQDLYRNQQSEDGTLEVFGITVVEGATGKSTYQVVLKDNVNNTFELISAYGDLLENQGNQDSFYPQINPKGKFVLFESSSTNLIFGTKGRQIFMKNLENGALILVSSIDGSTRTQGNSSSTYAHFSKNGKYIYFHSFATNFGCTSKGSHCYRKDILTGVLTVVSSAVSSYASQRWSA